jgi:pimeloyl-ACP methyl ester carboxylesterase
VDAAPKLTFVHLPQIDLAVWDWAGKGPALFFAHATGFHGRCWDRIARAFPGRRRLALEFRGHGRSSKAAPPCSWTWFSEDVRAVIDQYGIRAAIGIGHSMGGHSLVSAAAARPDAFAALLLIDPVIRAPEDYSAAPPDSSFILKRRARWDSSQQMLDRFRERTPFRFWDPEVLRDYCEFALLPDADGFSLACPPPLEAAIYASSNAPDANLSSEIPKVGASVTVIRARPPANPAVFDLATSPTWPQLASQFPHGHEVYLPDSNHYIPMEFPDLVTGAIRTILGSAA